MSAFRKRFGWFRYPRKVVLDTLHQNEERNNSHSIWSNVYWYIFLVLFIILLIGRIFR